MPSALTIALRLPVGVVAIMLPPPCLLPPPPPPGAAHCVTAMAHIEILHAAPPAAAAQARPRSRSGTGAPPTLLDAVTVATSLLALCLACALWRLPGAAAQLSDDQSWNITLTFDSATRHMRPININSDIASPYTLQVAPGPMRPLTDTSPVHWLAGNATTATGAGQVVGVSSPSNLPPARSGACAWTGRDGELYAFGGLTPGSVYDNAVHRYSRVSRQWTLLRSGAAANSSRGVEAAANMPAPRYRHSCVMDDNGDVWMYGQ